MSGSKAKTRRWFDRRARTYEGGVTARWRGPRHRASLEALDLAPADRLLDVGCGTGAASRTAAEMGASVIGVDLSPRMVKEAMTLAGTSENLAFEVAEVERLPFPDGR